MCEYARFEDDKLPKCADGSICTFCVLGNQKQYNKMKGDKNNETNKRRTTRCNEKV